jgi:hypothetical protein
MEVATMVLGPSCDNHIPNPGIEIDTELLVEENFELELTLAFTLGLVAIVIDTFKETEKDATTSLVVSKVNMAVTSFLHDEYF